MTSWVCYVKIKVDKNKEQEAEQNISLSKDIYKEDKKQIIYTIENTFDLPNNEITKNGYTFLGWTLSDGGSAIDFDVNGTYKTGVNEGSYGDATLQAKWDCIEYTITLDPVGNGNSSGSINAGYSPTASNYENNTITYTIEQTFNLPTASEITKTGYTFDGWEIEGTTTKVSWKSGGSYVTGVNVGSWENAKVKAKWTTVTYKIKFNLDNEGEVGEGNITGYTLTGTGLSYNSTSKTISYTIENTFTLPTATHTTKNGYTFLGWTVKSGTVTNVKFNTSGSYKTGVQVGSYQSGDVTLTANWEVLEYSITLKPDMSGEVGNAVISGYNPNSERASYTNNVITYTVEDTFNLPKDEITKIGYTFQGWKLEENPANITWGENGEYKVSVGVGSFNNATLQAIWSANPYIIEFSMDNSGEVGEGEINSYSLSGNGLSYDATNLKITYIIENTFTLPTSEHTTKTGYTFLGWTVTSGGNNIDFDESGEYVTKVNVGSYGNATLQANWECIEYNITLILDKSHEVGNASISGYNPNSDKASYSNNVITYTIEDVFNLPTASEISKTAYTFAGWELVGSAADIKFTSVGEYKTGVQVGSYQDATLQAIWEVIPYVITFIPDDGKIEDYEPTGVEFKDNKI